MNLNDNSFYTEEEIHSIGFKSIGKHVLISRHATIYGIENISIGSNVRIDDFAVLSGNINIGNFCHIASHCALFGKYGIVMDDFAGLSPGTKVFSATDDFSGEYLTGPTIDAEFTNVKGGQVHIGRYVVVGAGSIVLPELTIGEGTTVGALSLVNKSLDEWGIYAGQPARLIKSRSRSLIQKEILFLKSKKNNVDK